jgi:zinc transport system permease protein
VEWLGKRADVREDSAIAVFWTFGMAVGVIFSFLAPGFTPDLSAYLFGNILTITPADIALLAAVSAVLAVVFGLFLKPIMYVAFDREYARSQRIPVTLIEYAMMMCIALTIVACLRMVGIVLAISLLTLPQMTANLITRHFPHLIVWSILIGFLSCVGGLWLSYTLQVPSGAAIIFFSIVVYALAKSVKSIYLCKTKH